MRLKTRFILILFFFAIGAGTGYAWRSNIFAPSLESEDQEATVKKMSAVKPDNLKKKLRDVVPAPQVKNDFTFFDTLTDVSQNRFIDLDGSIIEKAGYEQEVLTGDPEAETGNVVEDQEEGVVAAPQPEGDQVAQKDSQKSLEDRIKELEALVEDEPEPAPKKNQSTQTPSWKQPESEMTSAPSGETRFQVQVSSFREVERARALEAKLQDKGYPAFYTPVALPGKGVWYRVFLGEFEKRATAEEAARLARMRDSLNTVILTLR